MLKLTRIDLNKAIQLATDDVVNNVYMLVQIDEDTTLAELRKADGFITIEDTTQEVQEEPDLKAKLAKAKDHLAEVTENLDKTQENLADENDEPEEEAKTKQKKTRWNTIDHGKIVALHNAGWTNKAIADEMGITPVTVWNHLKQLEEEKEGN